MSIDIICLLLLAFAAFKGYRKGLIVAIVSFAGFFIGLAAAIKLSAAVTGSWKPANPWIPCLAFFLIFIFTSWLVGLAGKLLHKGAEIMMAGPIIRIGGAIVYILTYAFIISLFLFFASSAGLADPKTFSSSLAFRHLEPVGIGLVDGLGQWIPFFRGMFGQLLDFFEGINRELMSH